MKIKLGKEKGEIFEETTNNGRGKQFPLFRALHYTARFFSIVLKCFSSELHMDRKYEIL